MPNRGQGMTRANDATVSWAIMSLQSLMISTILQPFFTDGPHIESAVVMIAFQSSGNYVKAYSMRNGRTRGKKWQCRFRFRCQLAFIACLPLWKIIFYMTLLLRVFLLFRISMDFVCLKITGFLQWNSTQFWQFSFRGYPFSNINCLFVVLKME